MTHSFRSVLVVAIAVAAWLSLAVSGAQAVVVDMNALGQPNVAYNSSDQSGYFGVALTPHTCDDLSSGTCGALANKGIPTVSSSAPCTDPVLTSDLILPSTGLCFHGGNVMTSNETFALTWDAQRAYWSGTRHYVEQYLRDVADASGALTSPYAVTTQYTGPNGRAQNSSKFGGGCIDFGNVGGSACEYGSPTGAGHDFPANGCTPTGDSFTDISSVGDNTVCLTDSQLQSELSTMITQTGVLGRTQPGHTPVVTLLLPPGVEACLDPVGKLCSANGSLTPPPSTLTPNSTGGALTAGAYQVETTYVTASGEDLPNGSQTAPLSGTSSSITISPPPPANGAIGWYAYITQPDHSTFTRVQSSPSAIGAPLTVTSVPASIVAPPHPPLFCSYHSRVSVGGTEVAYVVQPWTALTACDEPDSPAFPSHPTADQLSSGVGSRLVSPLSQAHIAAIVDPGFNGWFALDGAEINDHHGCAPLSDGLDSVSLASSSYLLQREFNNAGVIESEPNTYFGCAPGVTLAPAFVLPSGVNQGDEVQLDGSTTASTLIVPNSGYKWDFGDGTKAAGPSVVHSYATTGIYAVTLTVTDRGTNVRTLTQTIDVLGPNGQPPVSLPGSGPGTGTGPGSGAGPGGGPGNGSGGAPRPHLQVRLVLMPQGLKTMLARGLSVQVHSNMAADGFATLSIPRAQAKRAHLKVGRGPSVVIGSGTVSGIQKGTMGLRLRLSRSVTSKLAHLKHVVVTVRLSLIAAGGNRMAVDVAGHY